MRRRLSIRSRAPPRLARPDSVGRAALRARAHDAQYRATVEVHQREIRVVRAGIHGHDMRIRADECFADLRYTARLSFEDRNDAGFAGYVQVLEPRVECQHVRVAAHAE